MRQRLIQKRSLHRKLQRDLTTMKGQVAAIGLVVGAGVMMLIVSLTSLDAVQLSQERFYSSHQFADIFADLTRAPDGLTERVGQIPGVNLVESRIRAPLRLEVPGFDDPVRGLILSVPEGRQPYLNQLHLREGSLPTPGRADQVLISEPFAEAHGLRPGDSIRAIINGRAQQLSISGVALSPEFVYQTGPADLLPDYERFGVFWMNHRALANAFGLDGAFNSLVLSLQSGASADAVIEALDAMLAPYGGIGAYDRDDQSSHRFLSEEIQQLRVMATVLPTIFLGVAAFLLNVLMGRIVRTQRQQIAVLKAFGYSNTDLAWHFGLLTGLITLIGAALGVVFGALAAEALAGIYAEYFRFPDMVFRLQPQIIALAILVSGGAALLGTWRAVRSAVILPPAQAMRPPAPEVFHHGLLERSWLGRRMDQSSRIILRNLSRHRYKASLSALGIGLSGALLLLGNYQFNAIDVLLDTQYRKVLKMDLHLSFSDPTSERALAELRAEPGVWYAEGYRAVPVTLRNGLRSYRTAIEGMDAEPQLRALIDSEHGNLRLPEEGLVLTDFLASYLEVAPGDQLQVDVMDGRRRSFDVALSATVSEPIGVGAYMDRRAVNRLMREGPAITGAWLLIDRSQQEALFASLWEKPRVASIGMISEAERNFRTYIDDTMLVFMIILLLLAGSIAFAVVYNNARIAFAERSRELATLRVLGFTRAEVAWILIGEIAVITLVAIPIGWLFGTGFALLLNEAMSMDLFRIPFVLTPATFAFSAGGVLLATVLSLSLIARRLHRLDMISALKTVE